jgi:anaerobic magnesium-protoporphyrin IX monomethyl ester cyclase
LIVKVLLCTPPLTTNSSAKVQRVAEDSAPPLGLLYLAASLKSNSISSTIHDLYHSPDPYFLHKIECFSSTIIGISFTTPLAYNAYKLCKEIHSKFPNITVIAGGAHATALPEECIEVGGFDVALQGEGEIGFTNFARTIAENSIGECEYFKGYEKVGGGFIIDCQHSELLPNVSRLPFPHRDLINLVDYDLSGALIASRGCTGRCVFCAKAIVGRRRQRTAESILDEINNLNEKYGIVDFFFMDDSFTSNHGVVGRLCAGFSQLKAKTEIRLGCMARIEECDMSVLEMLANSGCQSIHFGAESSNEDVLKRLKKGCSPEQIEAAVINAQKSGIKHICCSFIIGNPDDTAKSIRRTTNFAIRLRKLGVTHTPFSILTPYPGSRIFAEPEAFGIKIHSKKWHRYVPTICNISTSNLSAAMIQNLYFETIMELANAV